MTRPKDGVFDAVKKAKAPAVWRTQVRRGLIPYQDTEIPVSAVVGVSFEGPLLPIDGILELRSVKAFAQSGPPPALWRTQGQERFKALVSQAVASE